jgi:hypothetical protein
MTPEEAIRDYAGFVQRVATRTAGRDAAEDIICQAVFLLLLRKGQGQEGALPNGTDIRAKCAFKNKLT